MTGQPPPAFGDIAHVGHVELFTPKPDESLTFFRSVVGLHESGAREIPSTFVPGATTSGTRSS